MKNKNNLVIFTSLSVIVLIVIISTFFLRHGNSNTSEKFTENFLQSFFIVTKENELLNFIKNTNPDSNNLNKFEEIIINEYGYMFMDKVLENSVLNNDITSNIILSSRADICMKSNKISLTKTDYDNKSNNEN